MDTWDWVLLVIVLVGLLALSTITFVRLGTLADTVTLQAARIEALERSELQMRGWFPPPDTLYIERGQ